MFGNLPREIIDYILELALPLNSGHYLIDRQRHIEFVPMLAARMFPNGLHEVDEWLHEQNYLEISAHSNDENPRLDYK